MNLRMRPITEADAVAITDWRIEARGMLRTPEMCSAEKQKAWYASLQQAGCPHNYYVFRKMTDEVGEGFIDPPLVAVGGLTNISWENRIAELSLIVHPFQCRKGIGTQCVDMLLEEAFMRMGLKTVFGEVYGCNGPGWQFWGKTVHRFRAATVILPNRKFWDGKWWDGNYFSIDAEDYRRAKE